MNSIRSGVREIVNVLSEPAGNHHMTSIRISDLYIIVLWLPQVLQLP
jgi:hypothetical protein